MTALGIAVSSGSLKGVFAHGVLAGLEDSGVRADVYGGVSSSTLSTGLAAASAARSVGVQYWLDALGWTREYHGDMSRVVRRSINEYGPVIVDEVVKGDDAPKLGIFTCRVRTDDAAATAQGEGAARFGRRVLVNLLRGDSTWVDANLEGRMFWSGSVGNDALTASNFGDVAYASTRMMHAWPQPAWVEGTAYVDGSYLRLIPDDEVRLATRGPVILIANEPGAIVATFGGEMIPADPDTIMVTPDVQLRDIGVDFEDATTTGIEQAYQHGVAKGQAVAERIADLIGG